MAGDEDNFDFTMREWEQAWVHTRHLESMRGQYLGFFFTVVLGVTAIAGPRLAAGSFRSASSLITVAALALGLQLVTAFIYLAIVRLNEVLGYYHAIIETIKAWMLANGAALDLGAFVNTPRPPHRWAGTSGASQRALQIGLIVFPLMLAATLVRSIDATKGSPATFACAVAVVVAVGTGALVWLGAGPRAAV